MGRGNVFLWATYIQNNLGTWEHVVQIAPTSVYHLAHFLLGSVLVRGMEERRVKGMCSIWILKSLSCPTAQPTIQFSVHMLGKTITSLEMYRLNLLPHRTQHHPNSKYPAESQHFVSVLKCNFTLSLILAKPLRANTPSLP